MDEWNVILCSQLVLYTSTMATQFVSAKTTVLCACFGSKPPLELDRLTHLGVVWLTAPIDQESTASHCPYGDQGGDLILPPLD